jgi:hypothetical protein
LDKISQLSFDVISQRKTGRFLENFNFRYENSDAVSDLKFRYAKKATNIWPIFQLLFDATK